MQLLKMLTTKHATEQYFPMLGFLMPNTVVHNATNLPMRHVVHWMQPW